MCKTRTCVQVPVCVIGLEPSRLMMLCVKRGKRLLAAAWRIKTVPIESSRETVACRQDLPCLRMMKRGRDAFDDNNQAQQGFMNV